LIMENRAHLIIKGAMRYGLYLGPALIAFNLFFYLAVDLASLDFGSITTLVFLLLLVPYLIGVYICMRFFRNKELSGYLSYVEGVRFGTTLMFFVGLFIIVYNLVFDKWIDPQYVGHVLDVLGQKAQVYAEQHKESAESMKSIIASIDSMKATADIKPKVGDVIMSIPVYAFGGLVMSLVIAAILKRKGDPFASAKRNND
jgi:hypothetical protein